MPQCACVVQRFYAYFFHLTAPSQRVGPRSTWLLFSMFYVPLAWFNVFTSTFRPLIATAALFLAAKSEETPCPLNNVVRVSTEIFHKQDFNLLCYLLPADWFDQYREKVIEAEQTVLTTLNFELTVQHPYGHLTSMLDKLGLAQSLLVNLALSLVSEG
ncbi:putative cyclin [Helianthus annuus]|nr:putative cyclin [Helianthus annuus]KAJ0620624.1 putative cyclin [Helianthus annuus]